MSTKLTLERLRKHNLNVADGGTGTEDPKDVRKTYEENLNAFAKEVYDARQGNRIDEKTGQKIAPIDVPLEESLQAVFKVKDLNTFLKQMDVYVQSDTLESVSRRFGYDNLNKVTTEDLMIKHSSFSNPMNTEDVTPDHRFIIPEIFSNAIRTGYTHSSLHSGWIRGTQNMSQKKLRMPRIERGDAVPRKLNEGEDIPVGSIKFGVKDVNVFKVGQGFNITDELIQETPLDLVFIFLGEVGNDMSIGADVQAMDILINGEQADGSESAPVIGTEDGTKIAPLDLRRLKARMNRMRMPISRALLDEDTSVIDLNAAMTEREEKTIAQYLGVPEDNWVLPANQSLFLNTASAMVKLQYRGMMIERRRNIRNQTEELFVSDWINFAIIKRDGRVIMDKSKAFSSFGFPAYMDIDTRINVAFEEQGA